MRNEGNVTGSTFYPKNESPQVSLPADGQILSPNNKILVCSSDFDTQLLLKTILGLWGFQPQMCESVNQTKSIVKDHQPNLILLDSVLPFAAHLENIRQIRRNRQTKNIPIIVISGFSQPQFRKLSLEAGAHDFFVKPLDFDLLEHYLKRFFVMPDNKNL